MAKQTAHTYRRLISKIAAEISRLQPGADPKLTEKLNKKFKKYSQKLDAFAAQK